jgi:uncharacterized protein
MGDKNYLDINQRANLNLEEELRVIIETLDNSNHWMTPLEIALSLKNVYGYFIHLPTIVLYLHESLRSMVEKDENNCWGLIGRKNERSENIADKFNDIINGEVFKKTDIRPPPKEDSSSFIARPQNMPSELKQADDNTPDRRNKESKKETSNGSDKSDDEQHVIVGQDNKTEEHYEIQKIDRNTFVENKLSSKLLMKAVKERDALSVIIHLKKNADPDIRDIDRNTPLLLAIFDENTKIAEILLRAGADPNIENNENEFPLMKAVNNGDVNLAKLLFSFNAEPNQIDEDGDTPLSMAITFKNKSLIELLLTNGADPLLSNKKGETPLKKARHLKILEIWSLVKSFIKKQQ